MMVGMLSTKDNPWNPFDHFSEWYAWDSKSGYHTSGLLARRLTNSEELSELAQQEIINETISEIVDENYNGVLVAVWRDLPHPFADG